jgi:hypothetical protein
VIENACAGLPVIFRRQGLTRSNLLAAQCSTKSGNIGGLIHCDAGEILC